METYASAVLDFKQARERANLQEFFSRLTGKSTELLSYEEVRQKLKASGVSSRGLREIPLDAIIGSVGRYNDFTRSFLPRHDSDRDRWARVHLATSDLAGLPPVEIYQIGDAYFVHDGHHRVSVARQLGATVIQAYVTEVRSKVPLSADIQPEDLILKAEQVDFLEQTHLAELRPENEFGASLEVTCAGRYEQMLEHIDVHRYYLGLEQHREVQFEEAAVSWFDNVYLPVVETIRELGILRDFPERTEADLYLWMSKRKAEVEEEVGWSVPTSSVAVDMAEKETTSWNRLVSRVGKQVLNIVIPISDGSAKKSGMWRRERLAEKSEEQLFADVLVGVNDQELSWLALEQAAIVVQREQGMLIGLYAVPQVEDIEDAATKELQDWFLWRAGELGVDRHFVTEVGQVGRVICDRARWADLVVVNLSYPPQDTMLSRLQSGFRNLINQCSRPILVVPGVMSQLSRPLLAYDDSPKAKEALFVATYLAGKWGLQLDVVTVENDDIGEDQLEQARSYLMTHGVEANYHLTGGPAPESILAVAAAQQRDLLIMGGYRGTALRDVVLGSAVDTVLRQIDMPLLICR